MCQAIGLRYVTIALAFIMSAALLGSVTAAAASCDDLSASKKKQKDTPNTSSYLDLAKRYADALVDHGCDAYGDKHTAMILSIMDRHTFEPFDDYVEPPSGIRAGDLVGPYGSNVNLDQNMYRVLYALSEITGDKKYSKAADAALSAFLEAAPSPVTNLFAWGEHIYYNLKTDAMGQGKNAVPHHEPKRPTVLFEKFYALNPAATIAYCDGLWKYQIGNHATGNFSRHARYDIHGPGKNYDFPKEAGFFIHDWSRAYQKTGSDRFLHYIDVLASRYMRKLQATDKNLIAFDSVRGFSASFASLSLAIECHLAAEKLGPGRLCDKLLSLSQSIDKGLLALPHDVKDKGFVNFVTAENDYKMHSHHNNGGWSFTWDMKYGRKTTAMVGVLCYSRYKQLSAGTQKDKYKQFVLEAADKYLTTAPDMNAQHPWPLEIGIVTFLELAAHEITGERRYFDRAKYFADFGMATYWPDDSPLPKADPGCDHYESTTRADTLVYALLKIYAFENSLPVKIDISDIDR